MLDASVVEGCQPEVACNRRFFVVEQRSFGMPELVVLGGFAACILGACSLLVGGRCHGFVAGEGVAG
jgi:hypothetical protein